MTLRKRDATMPNENPKRTCTEQDVSLPLKLYPEAIQQDPKRLARMRILGDTVARFNAMSTDETEAIRNRGMSERPKLLDVEAKSALRILVVERDTLDLAKEVFETLGIAPLVLNMANESAPGVATAVVALRRKKTYSAAVTSTFVSNPATYCPTTPIRVACATRAR